MRIFSIKPLLLLAAAWLSACSGAPAQTTAERTAREPLESLYVLGPDDQIVIHVLDVDEIGKDPY